MERMSTNYIGITDIMLMEGRITSFHDTGFIGRKILTIRSPCAHMKHDKVFIIPEKMNEVIRSNPNELPWKASEAFM